MSLTPASSRPTQLNAASALRLTPQTKLLPNQPPNKTAHDGAGLSMSLQSIIGTTASSSSGFDCLSKRKSFAICAGSVVVLAQLDVDLNITRRYFRAVPTAVPINTTTTFHRQATPPGHNRPAGSLRDGMFGSISTVSPRRETIDSPGKGMVHQRMKAAKCVSLSPDATLLAVGEVKKINGLVHNQGLTYVDRLQSQGAHIFNGIERAAGYSSIFDMGAYIRRAMRGIFSRFTLSVLSWGY